MDTYASTAKDTINAGLGLSTGRIGPEMAETSQGAINAAIERISQMALRVREVTVGMRGQADVIFGEAPEIRNEIDREHEPGRIGDLFIAIDNLEATQSELARQYARFSTLA